MNIKSIQKIAVIFFALLFVSCATPETSAPRFSTQELNQETKEQKRLLLLKEKEATQRVSSVGYKILKANAELCNKSSLSAGISFWSLDRFGNNERLIANDIFGLTEAPEVMQVMPSSPAVKSGIQKGDVIQSLNDVAVKNLNQLEKQIEKAKKTGVYNLTVLRKGKPKSLIISPISICDFDIVYDHSDLEVNAYADGQKIYITRGMEMFAGTENELATVIGHELAHNAMKHVDKKQQNAMGAGIAGLALDILAAAGGVNTNGQFSQAGVDLGTQAYSQSFETEADYVGLYLMARAGYDTSRAANFWRRMASEVNQGGIEFSSSHPTHPERFLVLSKTHTEIMRKRATGLKLVPEFDKTKK